MLDTLLFGFSRGLYIHISHKHEAENEWQLQAKPKNILIRSSQVEKVHGGIKSQFTLASISRDTSSAKTTQTSSKLPVQKRQSFLYGFPFASK